MKLVMQTIPASANSLATSEILLIFSSLSFGLNPRFLLRPVKSIIAKIKRKGTATKTKQTETIIVFLISPVRMLSPSRLYDGTPIEHRYSSRAKPSVVFPAPDRPVSQTQHPRNPSLPPTSCPRFFLVMWLG